MVDVRLNYLGYMDTIQNKIGQTIQRINDQEKNFADGIYDDTLWFNEIIKEIDQISIGIANEIQRQTGAYVNKTNYKLDLRQATFHRLLALEIGLASWLGWIFNEKHRDITKPFSAPDVFKMIQKAYDFGVKKSEDYPSMGIDQIIKEEMKLK